MLDSQSSLRLNLLRFPLIVGVVFIHAAAREVTLADRSIQAPHSQFTEFVTNVVSQGVARIAVPLFYLISGYLFFLGFEWSRRNYWAKVRSRTKTLLIPYVFWNCFTLAIIGLAQAVPASRMYLSGRIPSVANFTAADYLNNVFGITVNPIAYQFWFIRDLMIMVLLAPAVYAVFLLVPTSFLTMLFLLWFLGAWPVAIPASVAALFFCAGGYLAWNGKSLFAIDRVGPVVVLAYAPIVVLDALLKNQPFSPYLHKVGILVGVAAALYVTKFVAKSDKLKMWLLSLGAASFFVFATHQPLLTILRKALNVAVSPASPLMSLGLHFLIPMMLIAILVVTHRLLCVMAPRLTSIVTGGR